ncbi:hypothetical protein MMC13_004859 [Lambiella insularis]|nr:hypothetical protein [Lambiella insularis]
MSTVERRRGQSLHLELPNATLVERPPIAALFLIQFDVKAGYTIAWKRCIPGLELAESVEFKSLPSGLHNVEEDIVYFLHDDEHAGISAFINRSAAHWDRKALMLAVGALVPLENGRLGKSWKHADNLKELAEHLVLDPKKTKPLEDFWEANKIAEETLSEISSSRPESSNENRDEHPESEASPSVKGRTRNRALSSASALASPGQALSPHHPALSLPALLDTFGPLVYPLYKAALLRKRILMITQAPVELACNFVYDISILSNIPSSVFDLLPLEPLPTRLRPLFSVGLHDIDALTESYRMSKLPKDELAADDPGYGWVACTTDDVLGAKPTLYDMLVTIPPPHSKQAKEKVWPKIQSARGLEMKASQRDLRRYRTLKQELRRTHPRSRAASPFNPTRHPNDPDSDDDQATLLPLSNTHETFDDASSTSDEKLIEPLSWPALAYSSFMWWASAGEKRSDLEEESQHDAALLRDFHDYASGRSARPPSRRRSSPGPHLVHALMTDGAPAAPEMAIIAYFHRLTALILGTLAQLVDAGEGDRTREEDGGEEDGGEEDDGEGATEEVVVVEGDDMRRMGLDVWSEGDRRFVEELLEFYWGRKAEVQGGRVECCGMRIC